MTVIWEPTRDTLRAKALSAGGAIATQANALADRLDTAGAPYDRRLAVWGPLTQSRAAWSAAYQLAHEQADNAARNVIPGAALPFDDMTPPTAVTARARAAVGAASNPTTKALLEQLATAVEVAWRTAGGAWGSPETQSGSKWLGTDEERIELRELEFTQRFAADEIPQLQKLPPSHDNSLAQHAALERFTEATARINAILDAIAARRKLTGWDADGRSIEPERDYYRRLVKTSLHSGGGIVAVGPPMLDLEHALITTLSEAADFLAAS